MSDGACPYESAVVEAARSEAWNEDLRRHVCECAECADTAQVAAWLGDVATRLGRERLAPDPTYIWLRAVIEGRARKERLRSSRRFGVAIVLGLLAGLAGAAAMLALLPAVAVIASVVRASLATALEGTSLLGPTVLTAVWLGLPLMLVASYLLLLRPLR